jgi:predicted nucleic acid-binding protein
MVARAALPFGAEEAAIAACALARKAELWTLNPGDFRDISGLRLTSPVLC